MYKTSLGVTGCATGLPSAAADPAPPFTLADDTRDARSHLDDEDDGMRSRVHHVTLLAAAILMSLPGAVCGASDYFVVRVIDEDTGRGVPLVELRLPNDVTYWTDSAGVAALDEPSLAGREVFVAVRGHGYEYPQETFLGRGVNLRIDPGAVREVFVRRTMVAERLYRLTGEGIYRDSIKAGLRVPTDGERASALVLGQDTVTATPYQGRLFWVWGDTVGPTYWNFSVSAATSDPKEDPAVAVSYSYITDEDGRVRSMLPLEGEGLVWVEGLIPVVDPDGRERLLATYTRQTGLRFPEECGIALYDEQKQVFEPWVQMPCRAEHTSSHPFLHDGYWYLYPWLRVPNDWDAWETRVVQWPPDAARPSCVVWNDYRHRWLLLLEDVGDVYYAEADEPEGPYGKAVKVIEHDEYNFYNVATHAFFNKDDGREIFIEGTYTSAFSGATEKTPRYNYNQVMYRLRLDDPRLEEAQR